MKRQHFRWMRRAFGAALFVLGIAALLCGQVEGAGVLAMAALTKEELETVIDYCHEQAEQALEEGTRESLRVALETISDVCHPDSLLSVDTETGVVEVSGWDGEEGDDGTDGDEPED